jgi:hypothetical protein
VSRARFNWKSSRWAPDNADQAERWIEALDSTGVENVAQTLARTYPAGSQAAVWIGGAQMTKGFAEHWLADKTKREARSRTWQAFWTAASAVGRVVASGPVVWGQCSRLLPFSACCSKADGGEHRRLRYRRRRARKTIKFRVSRKRAFGLS